MTRQITRLPAEHIAQRRSVIDHMHLMGWAPERIAAAILQNVKWAHLLRGQADPIKTVKHDLELIRQEGREDIAQGFGIMEISAYIKRQRALLQLLWRDMLRLQPGRGRLYYAQLVRDLSRDIARAQGIEVDAPTVKINWLQLLGQENAEIASFIEGKVVTGAGFGRADIWTFATHEDYCGLSFENNPMEMMVLRDFMRPGSGFMELVDICGMRGGKGTVGSICVWHKMHELLELIDPQRYYGLTPGQTIGTYNMAMSQDQARENVFKHCLDRIDYGGRWFRELRAFCDEHLGHGWQQTLQMRLPKNLQMNCGHSRAKSLVGGTNIVVVFDELCKFKTTEGVENAEDVYAQMKATTATFGDDARILTLASPEWTGDYGYGTLLKMALETDDMPLEDRCDACRAVAEQPGYEPSPRKSHPKMMGIHMPTWEANTALTFDALWEQHNGAGNPRAFWRDFGARPAEAKEGYYPNPERWSDQGDPDIWTNLGAKPEVAGYPYDKLGRLAAWFKPCCDGRRYVHIDLAVSRDSCGIAMSHKPVPGCPWFETVEGQPNPKAKKVVNDIAVQVRPESPGPGQAPEIDFDAVRDYVREWEKRSFRIKAGKLTWDGWQSVDSQQVMRKEGFTVGEFSLDRDLEGHDTLQELINTDQLAYYAHPVLVREGKSLELKSGRKVDHPPKGSKDVVDAVAGSTYHAYRFGGRVKFIGGSQT